MTEAHPLRCETCKDMNCTLQQTHWIRDIKELPTVEHRFVYEYGCASHSSAKSDAVLGVGVDYILQKLEQEYDDGGYDPDIPLWIQVRDDLKKLRQKEREQDGWK